MQKAFTPQNVSLRTDIYYSILINYNPKYIQKSKTTHACTTWEDTQTPMMPDIYHAKTE